MTDFGPELPPLTQLAPGIRRLVAPNPSMMTGPGTNTYLFGEDEIAVLDPGPIIESHLNDILEIGKGRIRWIVATHTHPDHSPLCVQLAAATGAELLGMPAPEGEHQDTTFVPDRILHDGDCIDVDGASIESLHTPGHASNHLCFKHHEQNWIFTGDHVIDGSTVVINPPDGKMSDYLQSLERIKAMSPGALVPGHGDLIHDPARVIDWIIKHRLAREAKVLAAVRSNAGKTSHELVPIVYAEVDTRLYGFAERSLLAHLEKLEADAVIGQTNQRWAVVDA